ncbi:MAG TPA: MarR family winged helix-turn-helix transcriptional regulator [Candidatus Dormibacteraeota bacterium]|nr:MarR family winged helix-turn-helix transcriptional regulator [Candidatus Dormibacteraeota bacterium]
MKKVSSTKVLEVWESLARVHSATAAAIEKDMLPSAGIALGWYEMLAHLNRAPDAMLRFQDLARLAGITDSGASRRIEQMIKAGLIDRHSCPVDRRGVYAHLTAQGKAAYEKAHTVFVRSLEHNLGSHLAPEEADAVHAALSRL